MRYAFFEEVEGRSVMVLVPSVVSDVLLINLSLKRADWVYNGSLTGARLVWEKIPIPQLTVL